MDPTKSPNGSTSGCHVVNPGCVAVPQVGWLGGSCWGAGGELHQQNQCFQGTSHMMRYMVGTSTWEIEYDRVIQMYAPKLACGFIIFPVLIWDYNPQLTLNPPRKDRVLDDGPTPFKGTRQSHWEGRHPSRTNMWLWNTSADPTRRSGRAWTGLAAPWPPSPTGFISGFALDHILLIKSHRNRQTYWFCQGDSYPEGEHAKITVHHGRWEMNIQAVVHSRTL